METMAHRTDGLICVFAKAPRPGQVKTRLARTLGHDAAAAFAEAFLLDTLAALLASQWAVVAAMDGAGARALHELPSVTVWDQGPGDLGERIARVLGRALREHPWAIALGADSPGLPMRLVDDAANALASRGGPAAVLGPCRDGGFYLLGARALPPSTLAGVRWSTPQALEDAERALERAGLVHARLEPWFDVDDEADLRHLRGLIEAGTLHAPATASLLSRTPLP